MEIDGIKNDQGYIAFLWVKMRYFKWKSQNFKYEVERTGLK